MFSLEDTPYRCYGTIADSPYDEDWKSARMFDPVLDHYRCPSGFFDSEIKGELPARPDFFQFGNGITCYGRCSNAEVSSSAGRLYLPFDPAEVVDNLRLERYLGAERDRIGFLRKLYYYVRPFTNLAARRRIQKFHARNWQKTVFPHWPLDTTVENLCESLLVLAMQARGVERVPFIWFWPDGAQAALMMTHDVENASGRDHCSAVMDLNDAYGIKASFQVVPEGRYAVEDNFLRSIQNRGFDVEIQDLNHDGRLYDDREEFLRRADRINRYAKEFGACGFRGAVLYRKPEWYEAFEFSFDMSMPNVAPMDPQRGGCCTVMPYFIGDLLELPTTTAQDYTLFNVLNQHSIELWKMQMNLIQSKNGLISFIVHPDYITEQKPRAVYESLLRHIQTSCQQNRVWCARPSEVDNWWRARSKMTLEKQEESWRIKGKGAEKARLAYAVSVNGSIVYEVAQRAGPLARASATL